MLQGVPINMGIFHILFFINTLLEYYWSKTADFENAQFLYFVMQQIWEIIDNCQVVS